MLKSTKSAQSGVCIGFDLGGTKMLATAFDSQFRPLARKRKKTKGHCGHKAVVERMFDTLDEPRFTITETILEGERAVLIWDFDFRVKSWRPEVTRRIHGLSVVRFGPDGRVTWHRDYWDAAGELYATLPLVGPHMRFLARRIA